LVVRVIEKGDRSEMSWLGVRFFRKSSGLHYKGIVHNKAVYKGGCAATDIIMHHYGYSLSPEKMMAKRERTGTLLLSRLEQNERDHAALYYMTQLRIGEKRYAEAETYGLRFFECVPVGPKDFQFYSIMYFYMAWIYLHLDNGGASAAWALKGLEFYPDDIDLNYIMARLGYQAEKDEWLKGYGQRYLELVEKRRAAVSDNGDSFEGQVDTTIFNNRTIYTADTALTEHITDLMQEALIEG
jgi:hypothetical protein